MPNINWGNLVREAGDTLNPFNGDVDYDISPDISLKGGDRNPINSTYNGVNFGVGTQKPSPRSTPRDETETVPNRPTPQPTPTGPSGTGTGSGPAASDYDSEDLAYLDEQEGTLNRQFGRTESALVQALDAILQNYNKVTGEANKTRSRNLEDFDTKTQISEQGRSRELGKVDTRSRMLADSLRQRLGLAGGSGSSAYQLAAPKAVQRQASQERGDVLADYSANFQALDTDKRRGEEDYNSLLEELQKQRVAREGGVRGDIEEQRNSIRDNLGRVAGERQKLMGGGYSGVRSAMAPYQSQIQEGESLIDSIYNKYAAKYQVNPLQARSTNLRDYATDKVAVRDNAATGQQNEYAPYRRFNDDEEQLV